MEPLRAMIRSTWAVRAAFMAVGAAVGMAYYTFVGCNGTCPLTGSPWSSMAFGAVLGGLAAPTETSSRSTATEGNEHER